MNRWRFIAVWIIGIILFCFPPARARNLVNPGVGYTIDLPDQWEQIPPNNVDEIVRLLKAPSAYPGQCQIVAAYHLEGSLRDFQLPYLVIEADGYPDGGTVDSVSELRLRKVAVSLSGCDADDLRKSLTPLGQTLFGNGSVRIEASYFTDPPGFQASAAVKTTFSSYRAALFALVGRDHVVCLQMYAAPDQLAQYLPEFQQIAAHFHLLPSEQAPLNNVKTDLLLLAAVVGFLAIVGYIFLRFVKTQPAPDQSPDWTAMWDKGAT